MNQSKFSLADLLSLLATIAFGFVCFLGANFLNIDNDKVWGMPHTIGCIVMALFCSLLLFGTAYGAKLLKKTNSNFKTCFIWEVILLILFVLFAFFFSMKISPFPHYFTVSKQHEIINNKLNIAITQAEQMFLEYENYAENREMIYKNKLQSVVSAKSINPTEYADYGFENNSVSDDKQIENKMFMIHTDLFPSNYSQTNGIKEVATEWLRNAKNSTIRWKPISVVNIVNHVETNSNDWLNTLITQSQNRAKGEDAIDFSYSLSFDDIIMHFNKIESPTGLSIGLALLTYMLMILSWVVSKRSSRFPGFKLLFSIGKKNENEL